MCLSIICCKKHYWKSMDAIHRTPLLPLFVNSSMFQVKITFLASHGRNNSSKMKKAFVTIESVCTHCGFWKFTLWCEWSSEFVVNSSNKIVQNFHFKPLSSHQLFLTLQRRSAAAYGHQVFVSAFEHSQDQAKFHSVWNVVGKIRCYVRNLQWARGRVSFLFSHFYFKRQYKSCRRQQIEINSLLLWRSGFHRRQGNAVTKQPWKMTL